METNNNNNFYKKFTVARSRTSTAFSGVSKPNINFSRSLKNIKRTHFTYAIILVVVVGAFLLGRHFSSNSAMGTITNGKTEAPKPLATQVLNKTFNFPLKDANGKEVAKIAYTVETANLQDAFIYQGKLAKAVQGRTFLIFNLKITNPYDKTIEINAKDYLRIKSNNSSEQLAPEIHNDPVQIQAKSTKYTRIGLPINDTDKDLVLLIGELSGNKQTVNLDLKK